MIFDKDTIWNGKPIAYSDDDIKEVNKAIVHIGMLESDAKKIKNIQFVNDAEVNKSIPTVTYQINHKDKDFYENFEESE